MRAFIIIAALSVALSGHSKNKKTMAMEQTKITETVTKVFVATDNNDWDLLKEVFDDRITLDYSSMSEQPAAELAPDEIITQWNTVLPGFQYTHHQIGNFLVEVDRNTAHCFCYGTANHYLESEKGNLWTVVGTYDFDLEKKENKWVITSMKFNYQFQSGNAELVEQAIENQKAK